MDTHEHISKNSNHKQSGIRDLNSYHAGTVT